MTDNFADTPQSITEIRAQKEGDGSIWTPRDVVIDWLRAYDAGEIVGCDALVICFRRDLEGFKSKKVSYSQSSKDHHVLHGMLQVTQHYLLTVD